MKKFILVHEEEEENECIIPVKNIMIVESQDVRNDGKIGEEKTEILQVGSIIYLKKPYKVYGYILESQYILVKESCEEILKKIRGKKKKKNKEIELE